MLLPNEISKTIPPLYAMENTKDPMVICKFFLPATRWTWYVIEFDGKDRCFGYIVGEYNELGYFSLSELEEVEGVYSLGVERDIYFEPIPLSEVKRMHE